MQSGSYMRRVSRYYIYNDMVAGEHNIMESNVYWTMHHCNS